MIMTQTDHAIHAIAVKAWEEERRLAREAQYNFCNSPRIWRNFYIALGLLIAVLSYAEWFQGHDRWLTAFALQ